MVLLSERGTREKNSELQTKRFTHFDVVTAVSAAASRPGVEVAAAVDRAFGARMSLPLPLWHSEKTVE